MKQRTKAEKLAIRANSIAYGVPESAVTIIGSLVLIHRVDPHILALMPSHLPSARLQAQLPNGITMASKCDWLLTNDDKLMLTMVINTQMDSLKRGDISDYDYAVMQTTLQVGMESLSLATPQMENQEYCKQRYQEAFGAAKSVLDDMNERRTRVGAYKASGDNIRCIEILIRLLIEAIDFITVGEWYSAIDYQVRTLTKISIENEKAKMGKVA